MGGSDRVTIDAATDPFVLAIDIGSTASRGDVYDATGRPLQGRRSKIAHQFTSDDSGASEIDPDLVVGEVEQILTALVSRPLGDRIRGVALDTFASSLVGVGADGRALTPCYTYADSRCSAQVLELRRELDERAIQQRTGCRVHSSYLAPRIRWLRETQPEVFDQVSRWMSLGEYVYLQLLGTTAAGTSTAAWTGMLDRRTGDWDPEMMAACGVRPDQLSEIRDPDRPIIEVDHRVQARWPALGGASWFAPITDGLASNLGAGASDASAIAVAVATSGAMRVLVSAAPDEIPAGLWCYRVDGARSLVGGAVNDVGRAVSWLTATIRLSAEDDLDHILADRPAPSTPLALPYLTGERSTGWAANAQAVLARVTAATTGPMLARGVLEGVAISYSRIAEQLRTVSGGSERILASGRVTQDLPTWLQILADVLELPVLPVTMKRVTLRGTALLALDVLAPAVAKVGPATGQPYRPVGDHADYYASRRQNYQDLYTAVIEPAPDGAGTGRRPDQPIEVGGR